MRSRSATLARCSTSLCASRSFAFARPRSEKWMFTPPTMRLKTSGQTAFAG
jgi:hypothetical protein